MATSVTLPALGESVTEGTVTRWLKQPGDQVAVDEPLLEVSTDKVDTEIPSPVAGTLLEIKAEEDETVEVGAELCTIGDEGERPAGGRTPRRPTTEQDEQSGRGRRRRGEDPDADDADRKTETETEPAGRADRRRSAGAGDRADSSGHQAGGRGLRRPARPAAAPAPRSRCPRWASRSPRAP